MGFDCGFDMVPRLTASDGDRDRWRAFIDAVKTVYKDDPVFLVESNLVRFQVGEHPRLPLEGHKFLRFSSKVSGSLTAAEPYIKQVYQIARKFHGQRGRYWHELNDDFGHYDWNAVNESLRSYHDSPTAADTSSDSLASGPAMNQTSESNPELVESNTSSMQYVVTLVPGKGQGVIAIQDIPKGNRILSEKPIFTVSNIGTSPNVNQLIAAKVSKLSKDDQRAFLGLHNNYRGDPAPFLGIVKTNALPLGPGASEGGIYLQACRINHACLPNSQHAWNSNTGEETIHAVRDIAKGGEITISYSVGGAYKDRRLHLQSKFGFECTCSLCSLPLAERVLSDDRQREILHLHDVIGDGMHLMLHPQAHLQQIRKLMRLLKAEEITDSRVPRAYYDAFQTVIAHGDQARAKVFAERAYAARVLCEGEDSPSALRMRVLTGNAKSHRLFGTSAKWRQDERRIPKEVGEEEFEKWLWREGVR